MCPFSKCLAMPHAAFTILAASLAALTFAFITQYGFGVAPCELCLWQRVPYGVAAVLALIAILQCANTKRAHVILAACAILFLASAALAIFHSGVERHWWVFHSACTGADFKAESIEDMRKRLLETPVTRCDEISWSLFGLTMANLSAAYSLVLAAFAVAASRK